LIVKSSDDNIEQLVKESVINIEVSNKFGNGITG
jgi:hypothetical protein